MGLLSIWNWDYGIVPHLKLGLRDCTPFEIGILGLQTPPYRALVWYLSVCTHPMGVVGYRVWSSYWLSNCWLFLFVSTIGVLFGHTKKPTTPLWSGQTCLSAYPLGGSIRDFIVCKSKGGLYVNVKLHFYFCLPSSKRPKTYPPSR